MADAMTGAQKALILKILGDNDTMSFATVRPDGYPQATTVSYVNDGLTIYFGTWDATQKVKNIASCKKVSAAIEGYDKDWNKIQGLSLGGRADVVNGGDETVKVYGLMEKKFPQIAEFPIPDLGAAMVIRITPQVFSIVDYTKGFLHSELVQIAV